MNTCEWLFCHSLFYFKTKDNITMIELEFNVIKQTLTRTDKEKVVSNSSNIHRCHFKFSSDWNDKEKTATFYKNGVTATVLLDEQNCCFIPSKFLKTSNRMELQVGVFGVNGDSVITSTLVTIPLVGGSDTDGTEVEVEYNLFEQIMQRIDQVKKGEVEPSLVQEVLSEYLEEHPVDDIVTEEVVDYITEHIAEFQGAEGKSAYEVAVAQGFDGTVADWIESLKGEKGETGETYDDTEVRSAIDDLGESKLTKKKIYTEIEGTKNVGLWKKNKIAYPSSTSWTYEVITSGFSAGDRIAITGGQADAAAYFPLCAFYDANMNLLEIVGFSETKKVIKYETVIPSETASIYVNGSTSGDYSAAVYAISYSNSTVEEMLAPLESNIASIESGNVTQHELYDFYFENWLERNFRNGEYMQFNQKTLDHAIITFSIDDSRKSVSSISDLFIEKGVPLCLSTIPSRLAIVCDNGDTVLQTCQKTVANGGEILAHNTLPLESDATAQEYFDHFVTTKMTLENAGFKVRGIIKAGGSTSDPDSETVMKYLRSFYDYGTGFRAFTSDNRYALTRESLKSDLDSLKSRVYNQRNGGIINFWGHEAEDIGDDWLEKISALIDYIQTIEGAEIVTIGEMILNNYVPSFVQ